MKKIFGEINLTWKKLIAFAVIAGVYTACMVLLPITKDTSFRDIAIQLEWWILFGIIIISNSKSPLDSALKCFVFFLISQPLVYLLQVPTNGFGIFRYYKYWFMWTLACLPMGFIGYYINKKNWLSVIILLPMLLLLAYLGLGYYSSVVKSFPHHLLSCVACFAIILSVVLCLFDKAKYKIVSIVIVLVSIIVYIIINGGLLSSNFETYKTLDQYNISFKGKIYISSYSGTKEGNVEVVNSTDDLHSIKLNGKYNGNYTFTISDDTNNEYKFEYYYDKKMETVQLNRTN